MKKLIAIYNTQKDNLGNEVSTETHTCDRCGRQHAKVYVVIDNSGKEWRVGQTCCKRLFNWTPNKVDIRNAQCNMMAIDIVNNLLQRNEFWENELKEMCKDAWLIHWQQIYGNTFPMLKDAGVTQSMPNHPQSIERLFVRAQ